MVKSVSVGTAAVAHTPGTWRLIYFDAPTRGEQIRMLFAIAGVPLEDVRVWPFPQGLDPYKKAAMGDQSPLCGTDLCPAVTDPEGKHCVETSDIMKFAGDKIGLGAGDKDERAMKVCLKAQTLLDTVFYKLLMPITVQRVARKFSLPWIGLRVLEPLLGASAASIAPGVEAMEAHLPAIESLLAEAEGPYCCGAKLTYADVALFCCLHQCLSMPAFNMPSGAQ